MRPRSVPWTTRGASLALAIAMIATLATIAPATPAHAAPPDAASTSANTSASTSAAAPSSTAPASTPANAPEPGEVAPPPTTASEEPPPEPTPGAATPGETENDNVEAQPPPSTVAGMGSSVISSNNPESRRARADLEGTSLVKTPQSGVPDRMRPLQRAAWWTVFGTFALATTGGLFAGYAEVQEDRAQRLASTLDPTTGGQYLYADKQQEYEDYLAKGERQAWAARGLLIGAGVAAIAAVTMFAVDARRQQRQRPTALRRGLRLGRGGLEVRF
ncbi:MAG: hypothetical protein R3B09_23635 [Nannocystaceae bacterium]